MPLLNTTSDMNATSDCDVESITLLPLLYSLDMECPVPWPSRADHINQDYPFHGMEQESDNEFLMRRYLETLWLPESITPLSPLVIGLRERIVSPEGPEALHKALKPFLLSVDATEEKYRKKFPMILRDGGGAGDIEESMMWYSWKRQKHQPNGNGDGNDDSGMADEEGRKKAWMAKMERREVQVQILLYLLLLSVPCATQKKRRRKRQSLNPGADIGAPPKKRRKKIRDLLRPPKQIFPPTPSFEAAMASNPASIRQSLIGDIDEDITMEDSVELFMDKLCVWQILASIPTPESSHTVLHTTATDQRDWMQVFCEDVVEPLFREQLPNMCDLLRTKVFPHSPFSDDSDHSMSDPALPAKRIKTEDESPPSPLSLQDPEKPQPGTSSVSSIEEVRAHGASRNGVATRKIQRSGEVKMKRVLTKRRC